MRGIRVSSSRFPNGDEGRGRVMRRCVYRARLIDRMTQGFESKPEEPIRPDTNKVPWPETPLPLRSIREGRRSRMVLGSEEAAKRLDSVLYIGP